MEENGTSEAVEIGTATAAQPAATEEHKAAVVAAKLREMIITNRFAPGSPVRERALAEELQVSRTPLREALKILANEGLLVLNPRRGATVAVLDDDEVRELLQLLGGLEAFASRLACENITDATLRELQALHHEMIAAYWRSDRITYFHLNQKIHLTLVRSAGNSVLEEHYRMVNARLYRVRYELNLKTNRWGDAIRDHEVIMEALEARDGARLATVLEDHVLKAFDRLRRGEVGPDAEETAEG
ncbi:GntR family transcriptional regulator [Oceanicola sp. 502str15]|uniref:GntR family transcriptional regulator n=1 Tax=Oceanicola sp. 502str15 TaxID=2696061 RepID=UPI002095AF69|nr:GntR family transcriptional regulator [Oceanicola sp. 502str15]MCO6384859.1 FCD domain-containing protein [Oceanicola sp. 502str15]